MNTEYSLPDTTEEPKTLTQGKNFTFSAIILLSIVLICSLTVNIYYYFNLAENKSNSITTQDFKIEEEIQQFEPENDANIVETTNTTIDLEQLSEVLSSVRNKSFVYNENRNNNSTFASEYIPIVTSNDYRESMNAQLVIYEYTSGGKIESGYEGFEWIISLDDWKNYLQSISLGKNTPTSICSDKGCTNNTNSELIYGKNIQDILYVIDEGAFPPSGTAQRNYTSFNSNENYIFDLRIDYDYFIDKNDPLLLEVFSEVEKLLP